MNALLADVDLGSFPWSAVSAGVSVFAALITLVLALYTRSMAIATQKLALETTQLARDTVDASDRADEHHQQTLWPFVSVLEVQRFSDSFQLHVKNIGTGIAVRGTASIISGHTQLNPMDTVEQFGPIAIGAATIASIGKISSISDPNGRLPEWIVIRVTFESIFHSTGHTDWMFRVSTGELKPADFSPPQIMKRQTLDQIQRAL